MPALKPFQREDVAWIVVRLSKKRYAFLWNDMGTGKTPIMIAVADQLNARWRIVFCPAIAKENWRREIIIWQDEPFVPIFVIGSDGDVPPPDFIGWVICNYERVRNGNPALLQRLKRPWDIAILDEHQYLSNPDAQRTNHFYNSHPAQRGRLADWFGKVILASGTPMRTTPLGVWPHLYTWAPETIMQDGERMSEEAFRDRYTKTEERRRPDGIYVMQKMWAINEQELIDRLKGIYIRRRRDDPDVMAQLPLLVMQPWWLPVSGRALESINALADTLKIDPFDSPEEIAGILEEAEKHGRIIHDVLEVIGLLHADYIADLMSDIASGKALIFAHHRSVMDSLTDKLVNLGLKPATIRGGQTLLERQRDIDRFQNDPACRAAVVQLQVGSTAVNLTAATNIIFAQMDWSAMNNVQCVARAYARLNDPHPVDVRIIMSDDWLSKGQAYVIARRIDGIAAMLPGTIEHAFHAALHGHVSMDPVN
jgi:SWI/SNF-related matrix-associated actin-dependent regulator of chromatin subfamily A-like protein 1